jgi:hypothetical protein
MDGSPRPTPLNPCVGSPLSHASRLAREVDPCPTHAPPHGINVGHCSQRTAAMSASRERARTPVLALPSRTYRGLTKHF